MMITIVTNDSRTYLSGPSYVPGPMSGISQTVCPSLTTTLPGRHHHLHSTDEETEVPKVTRGFGNFPQPYRE